MKNSSKIKLTQKTLLLISMGLVSNIVIADEIHTQDTIVEGSLCVSDTSACAAGESFNPPSDADVLVSLKIKEGLPSIWLEDTNSLDWFIYAGHSSVGGFTIASEQSNGSNTYPFVILGNTNTDTLVVAPGGKVGVGTDSPGETLEVSSSQPAIRLNTGTKSADLEMFNNFFSIQESSQHRLVVEVDGTAGSANQIYLDNSGKIGFGVANPSEELQFKNSTDDIRFGTGVAGWALDSDSSNFEFRSYSNVETVPFRIDAAPTNSLRINNMGNIGVGTGSPDSTLHVKKAGAVLKVEDTNASTAVRQVLKLKNKGPVGFQMRDTNDTAPWDFRTGSGGSFVVANLGTAGPEIFVNKTGLVKMGPNVGNFTLTAAGNLTIPNGSVTATTFITSSSRSVKKDIKKLDVSQVMSKLKQLEVPEWRYKDEDVKGLHVGPIAEDFYKLFKLGPDNKHVAATDIASIAMIAAKELQKKAALREVESASLKSENAQLKQKLEESTAALKIENDKLKKRLASLEKLVTNLASANGFFKGFDAKIALK